MAKKVKIPWMVGKTGEVALPHYLRATPEPSDEGSGWKKEPYEHGFEFEPVGPESPYPGLRDTPRTHTLRWQEQADLRGTLTVQAVARGRSSATLVVRLQRPDKPTVTGTMDVGWAPNLIEGARDGKIEVTIAPRKRGQNYLFDVVLVHLEMQ